MVNVDGFTVERIDVEKLIPHPKNPRIDLHPGMPLYEKLKDSIEHHDYIDPIIWNKRTGHIIAGHQRFQVIKDIAERDGMELKQIPVVVVDKSENEETTFLVSDNKITGLWDMEKLSALFKELSEEDLRYTGYEDFEIDSILNDDVNEAIDPFDEDVAIGSGGTETYKLTIFYDNEEDRNKAFDDFKEKGLNVKK